MHVRRYNYPQQFEDTLDQILSDYREILLEGAYIGSAAVQDFESSFARYCESDHGRGTNTGTDAIAIALLALGVGPGDEVITQANTFNATVTAIRLVGARPVLVDADPETFLMRHDAIESVLTPRTRVLIPVHLYGKPTPMAAIEQVAEANDLLIVEDAAQAHGARIHGRRVGSFGVAGCFSFHPSKNLAAAGDAGCITTSDGKLATHIEAVRGLGQVGQNNHLFHGMNTRLDALQAVVLSSKLDKLDGWNADRRRVASAYRERLGGTPLYFQTESPSEEHVYHLFQIGTPQRDALLEHLRKSNIDAVVRYPQAIHRQKAFEDIGWSEGQFPVAEQLAAELLCLPIRPDLSEAEVDYVATSVRSFFA